MRAIVLPRFGGPESFEVRDIPPPVVLGYDASGVVEQVGPGVTDFKPRGTGGRRWC